MNIYAFSDEASVYIPEQIAALKRNGLLGMEIRSVNGTNISQISIEEAKAVRRQLDDAGLVCWSIGSPIGKMHLGTDSFDEHLDKFRHTLELANILGSGQMRIFSFYIPKGEDPSLFKDEVFEKMSRLLEISEAFGIRLLHENEKKIYGDTAERCNELLKAFPALGAVFDPANFVQCGEDTLRAWTLLKDRIDYLHIKDAVSDGTVVPAGQGEGNVKFILDSYRANGGKSLTLEPHLTQFIGLAALETEDAASIISKAYSFSDGGQAFDFASDTLKRLLQSYPG